MVQPYVQYQPYKFMLDDSHIASSLIIIKIQLMKLLTFLIVALFGVAAAYTVATCTETLEVKCVDAIIAGFPICEAAAKEKGKDVPVDLNCMKYFVTIDQDCWPCICKVAKDQGWNIKGC